jgi:hypothetical protein
VRLVHVHIHERRLEEGVSEDEVIRRIHGLQEAALPLLDGIVERVFHEHMLQADVDAAYVHLVDTNHRRRPRLARRHDRLHRRGTLTETPRRASRA